MSVSFFIDVFVVGNCWVRTWGGELFVSCCLPGLARLRVRGFWERREEKGAARHGANAEQSDLIYTGRHLITIVPSVSRAP